MARLRSVNEKVSGVELGQERTVVGAADAEKIKQAREMLERRTEAFEALKQRVVDGTMFAISILLGIAITAATMGTAGPLIAAGLTALQAQFVLALVSTAVASTAKELIKWAMVGTLHNNREILYNIVKSVALSATTVGAGEVSGAISDASPVLKALSDAASDPNASLAAKLQWSFAEKFLNVSPIEVAFRTIVDTTLGQLTAVEPEERPLRSWADMRDLGLRFLSDATFDALMKGTFDMMSTDTVGAIDSAHYAADETGEGWIPDINKVSFGEWVAVVAGENLVTGQNYSVTEQTAILPELITRYGIDKVAAWWGQSLNVERLPGGKIEGLEEEGQQAPAGAGVAAPGAPPQTAAQLLWVALHDPTDQHMAALQARDLGSRVYKTDDLAGVLAGQTEAIILSKANTLAEMGYSILAMKYFGVPMKVILQMDGDFRSFYTYRKQYTFDDFMAALGNDIPFLQGLAPVQWFWSSDAAEQVRLLRIYREYLVDAGRQQLGTLIRMARAAGTEITPRMLHDAGVGARMALAAGFNELELHDAGYALEELLDPARNVAVPQPEGRRRRRARSAPPRPRLPAN